MNETDPAPGKQEAGAPNATAANDELTIDLTTPEPDQTGVAVKTPTVAGGGGVVGGNSVGMDPRLLLKPYQQEKQRDWVRMVVTVGLLGMLAWVIVWSCFESRSWPDHWAQTKEMLNLILPALTGLIGSVIGFYFGSGVNSSSKGSVGNTTDK